MSKADQIFLANCQEILSRGTWDTHLPVRPRWEDGTPAHTVKCFGLVNRYDLREEFPIQTIRRMYLKSAVEELLWIWQKKSNNVRALSTGIWDAWADETGSIGKAYGYQMGVKHRYPEGEMDQVDRVLYDLKHNPSSRRILTNFRLYTASRAPPRGFSHELSDVAGGHVIFRMRSQHSTAIRQSTNPFADCRVRTEYKKARTPAELGHKTSGAGRDARSGSGNARCRPSSGSREDDDDRRP